MNDKWKQKQYRTAAVFGLVILLLLVCSAVGTGRIDRYVARSMEESMDSSREEATEASLQEEIRQSMEASAEASIADETAVHELEISYMEGQLLSLLTAKLRDGDLAGAASVLNGNPKAFQKLFFDRLEQGGWMYDGTRVTDQVEGHGLVFTKASVVFYGDFKDGAPSGTCTALQAVSLEEGNRYDYSVGSWDHGVMSGTGECGYDYYEGVTGESAKNVVKKGTFTDDLMEGQISYSSTNMDGNVTTWTMEAAGGIIVPDERWKQNTGADGSVTYQLMADNDTVHAYTVEEKDMSQVRWKNMIEW